MVAPTLGPACLPFHDKGLATWNQVLDIAMGRAIFIFLKPQDGWAEEEVAGLGGILGQSW